jgi:hypothetical protein
MNYEVFRELWEGGSLLDGMHALEARAWHTAAGVFRDRIPELFDDATLNLKAAEVESLTASLPDSAEPAVILDRLAKCLEKLDEAERQHTPEYYELIIHGYPALAHGKQSAKDFLKQQAELTKYRRRVQSLELGVTQPSPNPE